MQIALIILFGLGVLLFLLCFLGYALSAFRHHFVTGLISLLPVLNIITLPSLWDKNSNKFFIGLIGLILLSVSWFFGADKYVKDLISGNSDLLTQDADNTRNKPVNSLNTTAENETTQINNKSTRKFSLIESNMVELPFTEGRIKSIAPGSIVLEGIFENEIPIASIKQLKLMVKKSN